METNSTAVSQKQTKRMRPRRTFARDYIAPEKQYRLRWDEQLPEDFPNRIPKGRYLWHNHITHFRGMSHGLNGFRYVFGLKPVNYHKFERCNCGVTDLPHYKIRGLGSGKCVPFKQWQKMMERRPLSNQRMKRA